MYFIPLTYNFYFSRLTKSTYDPFLASVCIQRRESGFKDLICRRHTEKYTWHGQKQLLNIHEKKIKTKNKERKRRICKGDFTSVQQYP